VLPSTNSPIENKILISNHFNNLFIYLTNISIHIYQEINKQKRNTNWPLSLFLSTELGPHPPSATASSDADEIEQGQRRLPLWRWWCLRAPQVGPHRAKATHKSAAHAGGARTFCRSECFTHRIDRPWSLPPML
jgi:hypothetical protein